MTQPKSLAAISWSPPIPIEVLRSKRSLLPQAAGVYVFTSYLGPIEKNFGVLYVGKAKNLAQRVPAYLTDPENILIYSTRSSTPKLNSSLNHVGKVHLLVEIQQKYRESTKGTTFVWVRWTLDSNPEILEKSLINYLQPKFNERLRDKF